MEELAKNLNRIIFSFDDDMVESSDFKKCENWI